MKIRLIILFTMAFVMQGCSNSSFLPYQEKSNEELHYHGKLVNPIDAYKEAIGKEVANGALVTPKGYTEEEYYNHLLRSKKISPMQRRYQRRERYKPRTRKNRVIRGWNQSIPIGVPFSQQRTPATSQIQNESALKITSAPKEKKTIPIQKKVVHKKRHTKKYQPIKKRARRQTHKRIARKRTRRTNNYKKRYIPTKRRVSIKKPLPKKRFEDITNSELLRDYQLYTNKKKPINDYRTFEQKEQARIFYENKMLEKKKIANYERTFFFVPDAENVNIKRININVIEPRKPRPLPPTRYLDLRK